ncbi:hypothetical protein [Nonomuraea ceibae]|uniref:hypothetical protein n=1 Tax=Nonomuraea ceibae TaxID=1935170 RepID=UPI001C5D1F9F|nr:hypothetical protein [Nonomuraea ceibae]
MTDNNTTSDETFASLMGAGAAGSLPGGPRAEADGEIAARLEVFRQVWTGRRQEAIYMRDTADHPSAGIAGARADVIWQMLADLQQVLGD